MSFEVASVIRMSIVLICAGIANLAMKRSSASTRCAVWTIALLCGLVVPLSDALIPKPARMDLPLLPANKSESVVVRSFLPNDVPVTVSPDALSPPAAKASRPLSQWIWIVWALGFVYFAGRLIVASLSARSLARRSTSMSSSTWSILIKELRAELSVSQSIELRDGGTAPPFTWGLFRHFILLPSDADSWSREQQRAVLAHELGHVKRHDGLIQFVVQIICSIYWFHPIVWLAACRMRLERERACDDYAINAGATAGVYADHLLVLASGGNWNIPVSTVSVAHPSHLETRLRAILNPETGRRRLSHWTAAILMLSLTAVLFSVAAIHPTTLLSLSLPTSFRAMAAPRMPRPKPEAEQQPPAAPIVNGSVAGRVVWTGGAASGGTAVSAIATSTEGLPSTWVMGTRVAGSVITDSNGQYRIENLPPGLYHIVTGPVHLPRTFSDVSRSDAAHLVTVTAGKSADNMNFTCVRNAGGVIYNSNTVLTVTGKIVFQSFGGPSDPAILTNNADGSVSYWQFRGSTQSARYWWPGLDAGKGGVIEKMVKDGELVTVTGIGAGGDMRGIWPALHFLIASEVTRGGVPAR